MEATLCDNFGDIVKYKMFVLIRLIQIVLIPSYYSKKWLEQTEEDAAGFLHLKNHYSSQELIRILSSLNFKSCFEIGGNCGGRSLPLAEKWEKIDFVCSDTNLAALRYGKKIAEERCLKNIQFVELDGQSAKSLEECKTLKKSELIFSWATMIYIHPLHITRLLKFIVNSKCRYFIVIEQDTQSMPKFLSKGLVVGKTNWMRNYEYLINKSKKNFVQYSLSRFECSQDFWNPGSGNAGILVFSFERRLEII